MRLFRDFRTVPAAARGAVVAIGNFDGVHRGHRAVIGAARAAADRRAVPLAVLSFEPHPRAYFAPGQPPFRLTTLRQKIRLLAGLGVDFLFVPRFDREMAQTSPGAFVGDVLAGALGARQVVVGRDFAFGRARAGNVETLRGLAVPAGIDVHCLDAVNEGDEGSVSSSRIRDLLRLGRPDAAALLLGRDWEIEGRVLRGERRGRLLGFPTANLRLGDILRPAFGVYATRIRVAGESGEAHAGVANLGNRPTFGGTRELLEAHVFDFNGDLYGRRVCVALSAFLRPERKFDGVEALKAQIARDADDARRHFASPIASRVKP